MLSTILGIIAIIAFIWVVYDVIAVNKKMSTGKKVLWIILAIIFNILTAIIYFLIYKK